jgi:hypothetical protein
MSARAQLSKLTELRAKTDRELVSVIDNAVEVGLLIAASGTQSAAAVRLHGRAREIYTDALMLIPKVEDVSERRRLEERLKLLRETLGGHQQAHAAGLAGP